MYFKLKKTVDSASFLLLFSYRLNGLILSFSFFMVVVSGHSRYFVLCLFAIVS